MAIKIKQSDKKLVEDLKNLRTKTFAELSSEEKELLLRVVAEKLNLIRS